MATPPVKPSPRFGSLAPSRVRGASARERRSPKAGTVMVRANARRSATPRFRWPEADRPIASNAVVRARVNSTRVTTKPATTPSGRRLPPVTAPAIATGSTGSTQGEITVTTPARNAIGMRRPMG